jgi:hypothetical protein
MNLKPVHTINKAHVLIKRGDHSTQELSTLVLIESDYMRGRKCSQEMRTILRQAPQKWSSDKKWSAWKAVRCASASWRIFVRTHKDLHSRRIASRATACSRSKHLSSLFNFESSQPRAEAPHFGKESQNAYWRAFY